MFDIASSKTTKQWLQQQVFNSHCKRKSIAISLYVCNIQTVAGVALVRFHWLGCSMQIYSFYSSGLISRFLWIISIENVFNCRLVSRVFQSTAFPTRTTARNVYAIHTPMRIYHQYTRREYRAHRVTTRLVDTTTTADAYVWKYRISFIWICETPKHWHGIRTHIRTHGQVSCERKPCVCVYFLVGMNFHTVRLKHSWY